MEVKTKRCPNCSQPYQIKPSTHTTKRNLPLFLPCGHTICETCVTNTIKFEEPIECQICHRDTAVKINDAEEMRQNSMKMFDVFPVNFFMYGELSYQMTHNPGNQKKLNEEPFIDLHAIMKKVDHSHGECMECHEVTTKKCQQCATLLCDACFKTSHNSFITFKNHVLQNIESTLKPSNCKIHNSRTLDYYCNNCTKAVCLDCMMVGGEKTCRDHKVVLMEEVNDKFLEDLTDIAPKVDEMFKRLTKTAVDIGTHLHNIDNDTNSSVPGEMLENIDQHFWKLQSELQKNKKQMNDLMIKVKQSEVESLQKAKAEVAEYIVKAKTVLNAVNESFNSEKSKLVNLAELLNDAKQVIETPWYLKQTSRKESVKMSVNEDLYTLMSDSVHLEGDVTTTYQLVPTSQLEEDVQIPAAPVAPVYPPELLKDVRQNKASKVEKTSKPPAYFKDIPKYHSKSVSNNSLNSIGSGLSRRNHNASYGDGYQEATIQPPFAESVYPEKLREGSQEVIYVTHIESPHNFFVQRARHQDLIKDMLIEFRNAVSLPKPSLSHISEGKMYLVLNKADKMWQRCRVVSIDRRDISRPLLNVFCIDFGSIETVNIDQLRLLTPARIQTPPPLAINCKLANCIPKNRTWTSDDSFLLLQIIDNKQAVIYVRTIRTSPRTGMMLECDVTSLETGVNLAHALVFHERARMPNPNLSYQKITTLSEPPILFSSTSDLKKKTKEEVYITHIVNPDDFYVRKRHLQDTFNKLYDEMQQEYILSNNSGMIYLPEPGMACVVNLDKARQSDLLATEDGTKYSFARAVVRELPGQCRVRIQLVDTGHTLLVHWTTLQMMHQKFARLSALAIGCRLEGITPLNKKWSPGSVMLLQKFENYLLELHVEDTRNRNSIGVILYYKNEDDETDTICVNSEMVKYKFAVSYGIFNFNQSCAVEEQVYTNKCPLQPKSKPKQRNNAVTILKNDESVKKSEIEKNFNVKDKGPLRLEVKILNYQSPSLLYVALVHQQKTFNELFDKIQEYYSNKKVEGKEVWKVGDRCCTICFQSQTWRRAVILELDSQVAKVFYSDFACVETVPISELKKLAPEFEASGDAAILCHLCGVVPAVGDEWPSITKEYLKELLDAYKRIFITKLGNFKNKSLPVELWVYHTIQGGALEPNTSEWRCLNKKIIEQGLGVPDKSQEGAELDGNTSSKDDNILSFLNLTGTIDEWVQLEPFPNKPLTIISDSGSNTDLTVHPDVKELAFDKPSTSNTVYISDWCPPEPIQSKEFTAIPTYIDNEGVIYLHEISQQETLELIRKSLDVCFRNPDPKAKFMKWSVGELCIALYFLDNRFYRGKVIAVNNEKSTCLIHYVDYGNEELCAFENMRKTIVLHQIPVQAHKCFLDRIRPIDAQWDRNTLDYIHRSVVEKNCFVKITGEKVGDILPIDLKYDKLWINDSLVDFGLAVYTDGSKGVNPRYAPETPLYENAEDLIESDSGPDYIIEDECDTTFNKKSNENIDWNKMMEDDDDEDTSSIERKFLVYTSCTKKEFLCDITVINDKNILQLNIIHDDETNLLYTSMFAEIKQESSDMLPLSEIFQNKACVALYQEDNQWYRACILQFDEADSRVKVRYVDYGNIEVLSLADVREIKEAWLQLPAATIPAKLNNVKVNPEVAIDTITQVYADVFLNKGPFHAKVINYTGSVPNVELTNDEGELVYQELFEKGVFLQYEPAILIKS